MKKSFLLMPLLAAMFASCSADKFEENNSVTNERDEMITGYLAIRLTSPGGTALSRAEGDASTSTPNSDNYVDGSSKENKVNLVRFYFFDDKDKPVEVRKNPYQENSYYSYYDWSPLESENNGSGNADQTIEKMMNTVLVINQPVEQNTSPVRPTQIVAVLNPTKSILDLDITSLDDLKSHINDYLTGCTSEGNFVMSNSVYAQSVTSSGEVSTAAATGKNVVVSQTINPEVHLASSIDAANSNPITIYVERAVARVDLSFKGSDLQPVEGKDNVYKVQNSLTTIDSEDQTGKAVYVRLLGWTVTSTPTNAHLLKKIDENWADNLFSETEPWNYEILKRSHWAVNPTLDDMNLKFYSYNEMTGGVQTGAKPGKRNPECYPMSIKSTYMHENAGANGSEKTYPTKVIFAGQLIDESGKPLELAEYEARYYTLDGLKKEIANSLDMWYKEGNDFIKIKPTQLYFKTYSSLNTANKDSEGTYNVYFALSNSASKPDMKWYNKTGTGNTAADFTEIKNPADFLLRSTFPAKVWKNGCTYYYFEINHLGEENGIGEHGVVRNHIYDATITKLTGLGTPVYNPGRYGDKDNGTDPDPDIENPNKPTPDPDDPEDPEPTPDPDPDPDDPDDPTPNPEPIYPEKPSSDGEYIAAKVNILQWRLVKDNYEMAW